MFIFPPMHVANRLFLKPCSERAYQNDLFQCPSLRRFCCKSLFRLTNEIFRAADAFARGDVRDPVVCVQKQPLIMAAALSSLAAPPLRAVD